MYQDVIVSNEIMMKKIMNPISSKLLKLHADILNCLVWSSKNRPILIEKYGIVKLFTSFLNHIDPFIRKEGASGLALLCEEKYVEFDLKTIERCINNTDITQVMDQLRFLLCGVIILGGKRQGGDINFVKHFCEILRGSKDTGLILCALKAIHCLLKENKPLKKQLLENYDGVTYIETISYHENVKLQVIAEMIVEMIDSDMQEDEY